MMLIDSHCHLNFPELSDNLDYYLDEMKKNNVLYALCISTNLGNIEQVLNLANKYENLFASVGVHPDEFDNIDKFELSHDDLLCHISDNNKVIAIGETGLDYYHTEDITCRKLQQKSLVIHIEVAKQKQLPLVIHTRNAIEDTLSILGSNNAKECGAVMHCFTENKDYARKCLDMGFYISISGVVTFKNAQSVQEMAKFVPLDRLLIETDSPFLSPAPFRGKLNHPAQVIYTAQFLADLKQVSLDEIAVHTSLNFSNLFAKAKPHIINE